MLKHEINFLALSLMEETGGVAWNLAKEDHPMCGIFKIWKCWWAF